MIYYLWLRGLLYESRPVAKGRGAKGDAALPRKILPPQKMFEKRLDSVTNISGPAWEISRPPSIPSLATGLYKSWWSVKVGGSSGLWEICAGSKKI